MSKPKPIQTPKIVNFRRAGRHHAVLTVTGGDRSYCTRPCPTCPS